MQAKIKFVSVFFVIIVNLVDLLKNNLLEGKLFNAGE